MNPAGCRGKLAVPYVAVAVVFPVKLNTLAFVVPPIMVTFEIVTLPKLAVLPPKAIVVLPITTFEF
jgi:hypothetical protein